MSKHNTDSDSTHQDYSTNLLNFAPFGERQNRLFESALREEILFHYQQNSLYCNFLKSKNFDPQVANINDLPSVPVQVFKELGSTLASTDSGQNRFVLQSSATSGIPSSVIVDNITAKRQSKAMSAVMKEVLGEKKAPMLVVDAKPISSSNNNVGARYAAVLGYMKFASNSDFLLTTDASGNLELLEQAPKIISNAISEGKPITLFGFTFVLYAAFLIKLKEEKISFTFPPGSKLIHIGGWKKLEDSKVSHKEFSQLAFETLGIQPENVFDIYGFTEQMGINYPECKFGWKHVPVFSKVRVIDSLTLNVKTGQEAGLLEFTSPIPHSYPGNRILTDDVGLINPQENCGCGWLGQSFKIIGRRAKAEIRGCGDILGESVAQINSVSAIANGKLVVEFPSPHGDSDTPEDAAATLSSLVNGLERSKAELLGLTTSQILGVIEQLRQDWIVGENNGTLSFLRNHGLSFLIDWARPENLRELLDNSVHGGIAPLDAFTQLTGHDSKLIKAVPRGLISQWVSGNVPMLGVFPLIQAWLTRNPSLIRVSSNGTDMLSKLISPLETLAVHNKVAEVLLQSTAIVSFDHRNSELNELMSKVAMTRIAWGGSSAISSIKSLPHHPETIDFMFGPKTSFAVIDEKLLDSKRSIKKYARRVAADVFVFNQIACASPHTLYYVSEENGSLSDFCQQLAQEMEIAKDRFPDLDIDEALYSQINLSRALANFSGQALGPEDLSFSILVKQSDSLPTPTFGRTLVVETVKDVLDIVPKITRQVQSIGTALAPEKRMIFAEAASNAGALRFPDLGKMTNFDSPWDGRFLIDGFVKYVTLGGP